MIEVGKYYTAKPVFTKSVGESAKGHESPIPAKKMRGKCVHVSPRLVTLMFEFSGGAISESFRPCEVK